MFSGLLPLDISSRPYYLICMPIVILTLLILHSPLLAWGQGGDSASAPYFVANEGQWEGDFQFKCEVGSTVYFVTPNGMTVDFREFTKYVGAAGVPPVLGRFDPFERKRDPVTVRGHVVQIHYVKASRWQVSSPAPLTEIAIGENKLPHYSNYFLGRDSTKWRSRVDHYENIIVPEVWPGIDVEYRADQQGVETIYHVKPGADHTQIQMEYLGLDAPLRADSQGNLVLATSLGDVKEKAPFAFQQDSRMQKRVDAGYQVLDNNRVKYTLGRHNSSQPLTIDPLIYSTYFGGNLGLDYLSRITNLPSGDILTCGYTTASDFPTTIGAYQEQKLGTLNAFVALLTDNARRIAFSTLFGSSGYVYGKDLGVMPNGDLLLIGNIDDIATIPLTTDALDTTQEDYESFVALFSPDCSELRYSSYLGGSARSFWRI